jgi:hypothetical protein
MTMFRKLARLFTIKTRLEAFLVTYAIAVGAVERGIHYMGNYPGNGGVLLAIACLGVPFIAGAKLVDSVKPVEAAPRGRAPLRRRRLVVPERSALADRRSRVRRDSDRPSSRA